MGVLEVSIEEAQRILVKRCNLAQQELHVS